MLRVCNTLSSTSSFSEQFLGGLVKLWTKIEWMSDSSKKSMPWIYLKNKNLPSTAKQDLVIIFINLFWKSIGEYEGVSHLEFEVWKESSKIILIIPEFVNPEVRPAPDGALPGPSSSGWLIGGPWSYPLGASCLARPLPLVCGPFL